MSEVPGLVLAVNAGSSTLKFGSYREDGAPGGWSGVFEGLEPGGRSRLLCGGQDRPLHAVGDPFDSVLDTLLDEVQRSGARLVAVAHRIVHGGDVFTRPVRLGPAELDALQALAPLAPLHQPHNLAAARALLRRLPSVPQVGCFDTAFFAALPPLERALPLPAGIGPGVRRYGFHGLSYQWALQSLGARSSRAGGRLLLLHLGNGSSACAVDRGQPVATSMGFSALDGLMMGTRCGSLDPGLLLYLLEQGWTADQLRTLLWRQSGLLGVSGVSADVRVLRASAAASAREALALYAHRVVREVGALLVLLEGLDAVVFTGGIGEHDAALRARVMQSLALAGCRMDPAANDAADGSAMAPLHAPSSACEAWVIPCDEGSVAARQAADLLRQRQSASASAQEDAWK